MATIKRGSVRTRKSSKLGQDLLVRRSTLAGSRNDDPEPDAVHGVCCNDGINGNRIPGTPYRIGVCIGAGSYGQVRMVRHLKTNEVMAAKLESKGTDQPQLQHEWMVYQTLNKKAEPGILIAAHYGPCGMYNVLILPLMGPSLGQVFRECKRKFTVRTVLLIAIQMINRLEYLHSHYIVHQDIKPENCLVCKPPTIDTTIFLVDFGLSKYYVDRFTNRHITIENRSNRVGTPRYMSMNAHRRVEQSRRDDMEALGHMLMYFLRGSLPWQGLDITEDRDRHQVILEVKNATRLEDLCQGYPEEFLKYMEYVRNLEFAATPDYAMLRQWFKERFQNDEYSIDDDNNMRPYVFGLLAAPISAKLKKNFTLATVQIWANSQQTEPPPVTSPYTVENAD